MVDHTPGMHFRSMSALLASAFLIASACGSDGNGGSGGAGGTGARGGELTGQECKSVADCYHGLMDAGADASALHGEVQCLDKVTNGYCTHLCTTDADCCAVAGECKTGLRQVCSPFESTGLMMCFLSCEDADLVGPDGGTTSADGGPIDSSEFCHREASPELGCRSTGGGSANRKVCVP